MRTFFVGGNWKCNGMIEALNKLMTELNASAATLPKNVEIVCAPPSLYLDMAKRTLVAPFQVSAQNCWTKKGAFTGEIAPEFIADFGLKWVILGHSERRHVFGETEATLIEKLKACLALNLSVIYCIGETEQEREEGRTEQVLATQLESIKAACGSAEQWDKIVIAYEPVWAIGTGKTATPEQAQEAHAFVRGWMKEKVSQEVADKTRILYGGSVNPGNAETLAKNPDVDGFLVGGASLDAKKFVPIIEAAKAKL